MTSNQLALPTGRSPAAPSGVAVADAHATGRMRQVWMRLYGKWLWLALAGAAGLCLGGWLGWFATAPMWQAAVALHIEPILASTPQDAARDAFDTFVQRQRDALDAPDVRIESDGRVPARITLSTIDSDKAAAAARVAHVLDRYQQSPVFIEQTQLAKQLESLIQQRREHTQQLADRRRQHRQAVEQIGGPSVEQTLTARTADLRKIDQQLSETQIAITTLEAVSGTESENGVSPQHLSRLARSDEAAAQLLTQQQEILAQIESARHRMGENAPAMIEWQHQLQSVTRQLEDRARQTLTAQVRLVGLEVEGEVTLTVDELRRRHRALQQLREQASAEITELTRQKQQLAELQDTIEATEMQLDELAVAAQQLVAGGRATGRVVPSQTEPSVQLHDDPRPRYALLGGLIGGTVVLLLVGVVVATDQRILQAETAAVGSSMPLLGKVPVMGGSGDSPQDDRAAMSIHEIRALLEIRGKTSGAQAFALTSPGKGAGKTSLTVGLASSLALSGTRTLLVDCELMSRTGISKTPSSPPQSTKKDNASQPRQCLDEVMMMLGYLDDAQTDIFLLPEDAKVGLVGMLEGAALDECVMETSVPGLSILPAASAQAHHVGKLSARFIRRLLAEAKPRYDMILFDTGPIPGSVESLFVAAEVDEVILVVSRGELQSRVDKTLSQLRMIGARLAGTVFNRAEERSSTKVSAGVTDKRPISSLNMGSGIFAAAVQSQANMQPGVAASAKAEPPDDETVTPEDAGDMYQALLNEELDADEATAAATQGHESTAATDATDTTEHDVLDDLLDNVIGSAKRSRQSGKDTHS